MAYSIYDRTLAFAGLCQAVKLVQDVARDGTCDRDALLVSLNSITITDPDQTIATFGDESQLQFGLDVLIKDINTTSANSELTQYIVGVLTIERKLSQRQDCLQQLADRLESIQRQRQHFDLLDTQMINNLAHIYKDIVSPIGPRIQVNGTPAQLQIDSVKDHVRALLLAAIRSAVLWRQVGGKRRHLLFGRKDLVAQAQLIQARNLHTL